MPGLKFFLEGRVPASKLFRVGIALAVMASTIVVWSNIAFARDAGSGAFKQTFASPLTGHLFLPYVTYFPDYFTSEIILAGDFNDDGLDDTAFLAGDAIQFLHQKPEGGFVAGQHLMLSSVTVYGAVGDVNGDHKDDIALVQLTNEVIIILQQSDGTWSNPLSVALPYTMRTVAIADLNNDGRDDIAVVGYPSEFLYVLYQSPEGTLSAPVEYSISGGGESIQQIGVGDFNHDGRNDVAVLVGGGRKPHVSILMQKRDGSLIEARIYKLKSRRDAMRIGDVTGDGRDDIVTTDPNDAEKIYVAAQPFHDKFLAEVGYRTYHSLFGLVIADFNQDGRNDIAVNHNVWNKIGVYLQNSQGRLEPEDLYSSVRGGFHTQCITTADWNQDGFPDLASSYVGLSVFYGINPLKPPTRTPTSVPSGTPTPPPGVVKRVLFENFDGKFPGKLWDVTPNGWWISDCEKVSGNFSAWAIKKTGTKCGDEYPASQNNWMVYGRFDLANAKKADMYFHLWLNAEKGKDWLFVGASKDAQKFYGVSYTGTTGGTTLQNSEWDASTNKFADVPASVSPEFVPMLNTPDPGWVTAHFNLSNVYKIGNLAGSKGISIAFVWRSDAENALPNGAFVDDILITKMVKDK